MGTPDFAVPILDKLINEFNVVGVITQPDRPAGRGQRLIQSPVMEYSSPRKIDVFQPRSVNSPDSLVKIGGWDPEIIIVAAFGQILKPKLLNLPSHGCINVHASLLPRWRGAAPINAAILEGDKHTGVTIMKMAEGLDDGPVLCQKTIPIDPEDTAGTLSDRLSILGAETLVETIPPYLKGETQPIEQDHARATYACRLHKKDGLLNFDQSSTLLARKVRAYTPWPGSYTYWNEQRLIIHRALSLNVTLAGPGVFTVNEGFPAIGTCDGLLVLESVQLAGKRVQSGNEFLKGAPDWPR